MMKNKKLLSSILTFLLIITEGGNFIRNTLAQDNASTVVTATVYKYDSNPTITISGLNTCVTTTTISLTVTQVVGANPANLEYSYEYAESSDFTVNLIQSDWIPSAPPSSFPTFNITGLAAGPTYYFRVAARDNVNLVMNNSNTLSTQVQTSCGGGGSSSSGGCTISSWTPDPATVCTGQTFTQTSNCGNTQTATGTKSCPANQNSNGTTPPTNQNTNSGTTNTNLNGTTNTNSSPVIALGFSTVPDALTNHQDISLITTAKGATTMCFWGDMASGISAQTPVCMPYANSSNTLLTTGDNTKNLSVQFKNESGQTSDILSTSINLDTTPPDLPTFRIPPTTPIRNIEMDLTSAMGSSFIYISGDVATSDKTFQWVPTGPSYILTLLGDPGNKTVTIQTKDMAGNISPFVSHVTNYNPVIPQTNSNSSNTNSYTPPATNQNTNGSSSPSTTGNGNANGTVSPSNNGNANTHVVIDNNSNGSPVSTGSNDNQNSTLPPTDQTNQNSSSSSNTNGSGSQGTNTNATDIKTPDHGSASPLNASLIQQTIIPGEASLYGDIPYEIAIKPDTVVPLKIANWSDGNVMTGTDWLVQGTCMAPAVIKIFALDKNKAETVLGQADCRPEKVFVMSDSKTLDDGYYTLLARRYSGKDLLETSAPVSIMVDKTKNIPAPNPESVDTVSIKGYMPPYLTAHIIIQNHKPTVYGKTIYGATVQATFESVVTSSSIIADSTAGDFAVSPQRQLDLGQHTVTLYATTPEGLRSSTVIIPFAITNVVTNTSSSFPWWIILLLLLIAISVFSYWYFFLSQKKEKKEEKEKQENGKQQQKKETPIPEEEHLEVISESSLKKKK